MHSTQLSAFYSDISNSWLLLNMFMLETRNTGSNLGRGQYDTSAQEKKRTLHEHKICKIFMCLTLKGAVSAAPTSITSVEWKDHSWMCLTAGKTTMQMCAESVIEQMSSLLSGFAVLSSDCLMWAMITWILLLLPSLSIFDPYSSKLNYYSVLTFLWQSPLHLWERYLFSAWCAVYDLSNSE